jgi:hypothetical protein
MNMVSIPSTERVLETAIGVTVNPMMSSKNRSTVPIMRYSNSGNFDK